MISVKLDSKKEVEDFLEDMFAFYVKETCPDIISDTSNNKKYYNFEWNRNMLVSLDKDEYGKRKVSFIQMNGNITFNPDEYVICDNGNIKYKDGMNPNTIFGNMEKTSYSISTKVEEENNE